MASWRGLSVSFDMIRSLNFGVRKQGAQAYEIALKMLEKEEKLGYRKFKNDNERALFVMKIAKEIKEK